MRWYIVLIFILKLTDFSTNCQKNDETESSMREILNHWNWKKSGAKIEDFLFTINERGEKSQHHMRPSNAVKIQPRFFGHLKRRLCRLGLGIGEKYPTCMVDHGQSYKRNRIRRSPQFSRVKNNEKKDKKQTRRPLNEVHQSSNACSFVSCKRLHFFCKPLRMRRRLLRRPKRKKRKSGQKRLPFSCGLHGICCRRSFIEAPQNILDHDSVPTASDIGIQKSCGRKSRINPQSRIQIGRIPSGDAEFGEFPWQAAVLRKEGADNVYVCSGSLIDRNHVLTAAHCVQRYSADMLRIRLGEWDVNRDTEYFLHIEHDVIGVAVHPEFHSVNLANDIAVLRLLYPVDTQNTPHISPICLPNSGVNFDGRRCWVSGWGKNSFDRKGKYQNSLKKIDVPVLPRNKCQFLLQRTRLGFTFLLHPGMICAGGEPDKDACKGDGGGPLTCEDSDGYSVLVGIVSWGIGCGQKGIPGVYVNVEYYMSWISQVMFS